MLTRQDDALIAKLSSLLRLAEYLERSRSQVVESIKCRILGRSVQLTCSVRGDASTEVWATERNAELFEKAFKRNLIIRTQPARSAKAAARKGEPTSGRSPLWDRMDELVEMMS